jgi:hypothetical protein
VKGWDYNMANRFTDTGKWDKEWFRKLAPKYKVFWFYIVERCNHAGIWDVDFETASHFVGEILIREQTFELLQEHITILNGGKKWFIPDFIEYQYKVPMEQLNPENRVHQSVLLLLRKHNLLPFKGLVSPIQGCKDKDKDKDKDMVKDKEKERVESSAKKLGKYAHD